MGKFIPMEITFYMVCILHTTNQIVYCFIDGIIDCEVADVLKFCSGADSIPSCGFDDVFPQLCFDSSAALPTASTCDIQLRLPSKYISYNKFKEAMLLGVKDHDGLDLA